MIEPLLQNKLSTVRSVSVSFYFRRKYEVANFLLQSDSYCFNFHFNYDCCSTGIRCQSASSIRWSSCQTHLQFDFFRWSCKQLGHNSQVHYEPSSLRIHRIYASRNWNTPYLRYSKRKGKHLLPKTSWEETTTINDWHNFTTLSTLKFNCTLQQNSILLTLKNYCAMI